VSPGLNLAVLGGLPPGKGRKFAAAAPRRCEALAAREGDCFAGEWARGRRRRGDMGAGAGDDDAVEERRDGHGAKRVRFAAGSAPPEERREALDRCASSSSSERRRRKPGDEKR